MRRRDRAGRGERAYTPFSEQQMRALTWWCPPSPYQAVICDGAVRSGKTLCLSVSFVAWAMDSFDGADFALCGKTVQSLRRNLLLPLLPVLSSLGFECAESLTRGYMDVRLCGRENRFYLFGGMNEASASLIQGMTLGGVLFDEVALMPRSFVEQAMARCSMEGAKFFFNCNPESPGHWFYNEWILRAEERECLYLHFTMEDNPSLSRQTLERYRRLYSGTFYERFVEGRWVAAQGLVYPFFRPETCVRPCPGACGEYYISCDYGTVNPASFGLWGLCSGVWYRLREYYHDSRAAGEQRTDEEHYTHLEELAQNLPIRAVIVDPSAASFIACIRRHGRFRAIPAVNRVLDGIRQVADALKSGKIVICPPCADTIREFGLYRWQDSGAMDAVRKEHDHTMDDIRYFTATVLGDKRDNVGFAIAVARGGAGA